VIVDAGITTSAMTLLIYNISGYISQKLWRIADSFSLGAYRIVAKCSQKATLPMTSRDRMTSFL